MKKKFLPATLQKTILATKAQRHEAEKMLRIFPLCLRAFVAKFNFCKKLFYSLLENMSLAACLSRCASSNPPSTSSG
jgi:hypothetical protein